MYARIPVSPHPEPTPRKLAEIDGQLLARLIVVARSVPAERRWLAGIPAAETLEVELQRREAVSR
jgi:hypothetical protein